MPFCPECAYEYDGDVRVCPDCHVGLVVSLPTGVGAAATVPDDSWVGVCKIDDVMTSQMVCGLLDSNNIPSMVTSSVFQANPRGLGWAARRRRRTSDKEIVMVPREFRDEAELLLATILGDDYETLDISRP